MTESVKGILEDISRLRLFEAASFQKEPSVPVSAQDLLSRMEAAKDVPPELIGALKAISHESAFSSATDQVFHLVLYARTQASDPRQVLQILRSGLFFSAAVGKTTLQSTLAAAKKLATNHAKILTLKAEVNEISESTSAKGKDSKKDQVKLETKEEKLRDAEGARAVLQKEFLEELSRIHANIGRAM